jgi:8-oxo-dGTP pyrophosphatase MutT (NUDIX family)
MQFSPHELRNALNNPLPGDLAHNKMTVRGRLHVVEAELLTPPPTPSAVMLVVYPKGSEWIVILIKRPDYQGVHSGQISFPGGKMEKTDTDLLATALRETQEEINISPGILEPLGKLSKIYIPPSHFMVHPFVTSTHEKPVLQGDIREVEKILHIPVSSFIGEDKITIEKVVVHPGNMSMKVPAFKIEDHIIWGATAMILSEFAAICQTLMRKNGHL